MLCLSYTWKPVVRSQGTLLIHSSGEMHRLRTSDVSQATLASVAPVFTVVSTCGSRDNLRQVLLTLPTSAGLDWLAKIYLFFLYNQYSYESWCLYVLLRQWNFASDLEPFFSTKTGRWSHSAALSTWLQPCLGDAVGSVPDHHSNASAAVKQIVFLVVEVLPSVCKNNNACEV